MQTHELKSKNAKKKKKRVGRGGKRAPLPARVRRDKRRARTSYAPGRAGYHIEVTEAPGREEQIQKGAGYRAECRRSRKVRRGRKIRQKYSGAEKVIGRLSERVKVLGNGELKGSSGSQEGIKVSASAKAKIEKAGGSVK